MPEAPRPTWYIKSLRYGGVCVACGDKIEKNDTGWHAPADQQGHVHCVQTARSRQGLLIL